MYIKKQTIKNFLFSKQWFREFFDTDYFIKINGTWSKYSAQEIETVAFKKGEKIEEVIREREEMSFSLFCSGCKSIVSLAGATSSREVRGKTIFTYNCSCCATVRHYNMELAPLCIESCDADGNDLKAA
ncbi:MAG: hypothetical protein JWM20_795 [Patescibacteria group bacterium]|nr:hypothetical protein [Patescibacteria group bacterium]